MSIFQLITMLDGPMHKYIKDIPQEFLMDKEEMEFDAVLDFMEGEMSWDELCHEMELIEAMFEEDI